jgi:hypothetical protein
MRVGGVSVPSLQFKVIYFDAENLAKFHARDLNLVRWPSGLVIVNLPGFDV